MLVSAGNACGFRLRRANCQGAKVGCGLSRLHDTRISLAYLDLNYSWPARGSGFANSVPESQWSLFKSRNAQAKAMLLEAGALKEKDLFWYEAMHVVAHDAATIASMLAAFRRGGICHGNV